MKLAIGQIYTFEDGAIKRVASYYDPQEALGAAGLTELPQASHPETHPRQEA